MGRGELPQYIKDNRSIVGLEKDRHNSTPHEDRLRCLAFHLNLKDIGDEYKGLETRTLSTMGKKRGLDRNVAI